MKWFRKNATLLIVAATLAVIGVVCLVTLGARHNAPSIKTSAQVSSSAPVPQPVGVAQPASAQQVASSLNCDSFKDEGPSELGGVVDSGSCYIGMAKYAIDTFMSKSIRDQWLQAAEPLGVVPKWETPTSVTYPSVDGSS